ncbi:glycosyltransferase family 2 protein [Pediococcus acidilactici]|uniref:glycosyltransferase family 2 protein n=1 Tax=Pediococcus acidilactici TaxID=1254 RepID=UPI000FFE2337|nr:glycosyltransferase family A protein [Pediococcus acidilactici]QAT21173.1 glycosyltransferase family 2 protein [Pediococcus acidilactici]
MNEKISIVIPVYNMENYIKRCLDSILIQDMTRVKIICVNDGSTDKSGEILKKYADNYENVVECINIPNSGRAQARNTGIEHVKDGYIWFIDPDDYIAKNSISVLREELRKKPEVVVFNWISLYKDHKEYSNFGKELVNSGSGSANKIFKRSLIGNYRYPSGYWYEDLGFIPILLGLSKYTINISDYLYFYDRTRPDSQTNSYNVDKITDTIPMCEMVYDTLIVKNKREDLLKQVQYLFYKHLIINTMLMKFIYIKDYNDRNVIVNQVNTVMNAKFRNWKGSIKHLSRSNFMKYFIKRFVVFCYLRKIYFVADCIWIKYAKNKY